MCKWQLKESFTHMLDKEQESRQNPSNKNVKSEKTMELSDNLKRNIKLQKKY